MALCAMLTSCFTGIESTPKITARDIKKQKVVDTPEKLFLSDISAEPASKWTKGKAFYVTDPRISLIFEHAAGKADGDLRGSILTLTDVRESISVVGDSQTVLEFATCNGDTLSYRTNIPYSKFIKRREPLTIPFTVEKALIDSISARLSGRVLYVLPQRRINSLGNDTTGIRYIPVEIRDVSYGDAYYPLKVSFREPDGTVSALMMTFGDGPSATRNFPTLFAFEDPRKSYPQVSDENWKLITESKVRLGMTPLECRLALGAPNDWQQRPSNAGIIERWGYENGIYLVFVDGVLTQFRH